MKKHFELNIDGWFVVNNEIIFPSIGEKSNLLKLERLFGKNSEVVADLSIDCIHTNNHYCYTIMYNSKEIAQSIDNLSELQDYLNANLHGSTFLSKKRPEYDYIPLQITKGWFVRWNHLIVPKTNTQFLDKDCLLQDIALFEYKQGGNLYQLDVGYPEGTADAEMYLQLICNHDWFLPIEEHDFSNIESLVNKLNEIFHRISYQENIR